MIIGVTGFLAAGKGEVVDIIVKEYGFEKLAYGDVVREEADKRGIEKTRDNLQRLGERLRQENGVDFWSEKLYQKVKSGKDYVLEGMRYIQDICFFKQNYDLKLVGVDAAFEIRARRTMQKRRNRREDEITYAQFKIADDNDRYGLVGVGQQTQKCFELADFVVINEGSIEDLNNAINGIMSKIK